MYGAIAAKMIALGFSSAAERDGQRKASILKHCRPNEEVATPSQLGPTILHMVSSNYKSDLNLILSPGQTLFFSMYGIEKIFPVKSESSGFCLSAQVMSV